MTHWLLYLLVFVTSSIVSLIAAILLIRSGSMEQKYPGGARAVTPLTAGVLWTLLLVAALADILAANDPFFTPYSGRIMLIGIAAAVGFLWNLDVLRQGLGNNPTSFWNWFVIYSLGSLLAVLVCVITGTRFSILEIPFVTVVDLGTYDQWATAVWILAGILLVKLLDGLHGAACGVLLLGAVAVAIPMVVRNEHLLAAVAAGIIPAAGIGLYFARKGGAWDYRGSASLIAGLLFAVLTVLARQKTVAALVVVLPVGVIMLFAGGAMLKMLEHMLVPSGTKKKADKE